MVPQKILIIDDEQLIRKTTCLMLRNEQIATVEAPDGAHGIETAKKEQPDLILLDMMLPDMEGWEVMKLLKADPQTSALPIVLFTAADCEVSESNAKEKGAVGILHKPFYIHQLMDIIADL